MTRQLGCPAVLAVEYFKRRVKLIYRNNFVPSARWRGLLAYDMNGNIVATTVTFMGHSG